MVKARVIFPRELKRTPILMRLLQGNYLVIHVVLAPELWDYSSNLSNKEVYTL